MDDLIKALQIFRKYGNPKYPTNCEHDVMHIMQIHAHEVTVEDFNELENLGFSWDDQEEVFYSYKFGSA